MTSPSRMRRGSMTKIPLGRDSWVAGIILLAPPGSKWKIEHDRPEVLDLETAGPGPLPDLEDQHRRKRPGLAVPIGDDGQLALAREQKRLSEGGRQNTGRWSRPPQSIDDLRLRGGAADAHR